MKRYFVAVRIDSAFGPSIHSLSTDAESQNEAVREVAKVFLHIGLPYEEEYRRNKVEILSITEIEDVNGFKSTFTQLDFKEVIK